MAKASSLFKSGSRASYDLGQGKNQVFENGAIIKEDQALTIFVAGEKKDGDRSEIKLCCLKTDADIFRARRQ